MNVLRETIQASMRRRWLHRNRAAFSDEGPSRKPRLLVDVSVIVRNDAGTGIQRVVRSVWSQLLAFSNGVFDVVPVYATRGRGYCYAAIDFLSKRQRFEHIPVGVKDGDHFLGLDLAAHNLPKWSEQIDYWRANGAKVHVVVYDLLPWLHPAWFSSVTSEQFSSWLDAITKRADQLLCISENVAADLGRLLGRVPAECKPLIGRLHLSGDVAGSVPSLGLTPEVLSTLRLVRKTPTVLMVGTVEPRKAYDKVISAFEVLWKSSAEVPSLLIIGRPGWKTVELQHRILNHPEFGHRLLWLQQASDEALDHAYLAARAVLLASYAEGFGLPLAEAAMHRRWSLVRDLPVFREQRLPNVNYFTDDSAIALARAIEKTVRLAKTLEPPSADIPGWSSCVEKLIQEIGLGGPQSPKRNPLISATTDVSEPSLQLAGPYIYGAEIGDV